MGAWDLKHKAQLQEWQERVVACRSSGMSVSAWCKEQDVNVRTYYRWEKEVLAKGNQEKSIRKQESYPAFVEVQAVKKASQPVGVEAGSLVARLHTCVGALDIYTGADAETLRMVIMVMKDAEGF